VRDVGSDSQLWDADLVVETLASLAGTHRRVLAAGDLNESRVHDEVTGKPWAHLLFARALNAGLHSPTFRDWAGERPTHGRFQIDHLLATVTICDLIGCAEVVVDGPLAPARSDHRALRFEIAGI
jgi:endonuclease/exonuclease/phosphatase family metal-dependent hydrolase